MAKKTAPKKGKFGKMPSKRRISKSSLREKRALKNSRSSRPQRAAPLRRAGGARSVGLNAPARAQPTMPEELPAVMLPDEAEPKADAQPARAPRRRIIGEDISKAAPVVAAPGEPQGEEAAQAAAPAAPEIPELHEPTQQREEARPVLPFVDWRQVPSSYPSFAQSFFSLALLECERAVRWPFAFARFIAELPKICGASHFLVCMLALELEIDSVAKLVGLDLADALQLQRGGDELIQTKFAEICPELERQWSIVLSGPGPKNDTMLERFYIEGVDKKFQLLVGRLVLRALGATHPVINGKACLDRWSLSPVVM